MRKAYDPFFSPYDPFFSLFQGGRIETATGNYELERRDYDPQTGTWKEQDPAGYINGADRYQFELGGPTSGTDATGLSDDALSVLDQQRQATEGKIRADVARYMQEQNQQLAATSAADLKPLSSGSGTASPAPTVLVGPSSCPVPPGGAVKADGAAAEPGRESGESSEATPEDEPSERNEGPEFVGEVSDTLGTGGEVIAKALEKNSVEVAPFIGDVIEDLGPAGQLINAGVGVAKVANDLDAGDSDAALEDGASSALEIGVDIGATALASETGPLAPVIGSAAGYGAGKIPALVKEGDAAIDEATNNAIRDDAFRATGVDPNDESPSGLAECHTAVDLYNQDEGDPSLYR